MPLSQLQNSAAHARCTFVLWLITITYQANLLLSLILLSILFIYSSDIVYSSFGIDCANLFLLKSQTISRYVYWTVTTQVRRLVQSQTNGDIFTLLVLCVKKVFMLDVDDVCEKSIYYPSLMDISVNSSVFVVNSSVFVVNSSVFVVSDVSYTETNLLCTVQKNRLHTINAMHQFCGPEQSIC